MLSEAILIAALGMLKARYEFLSTDAGQALVEKGLDAFAALKTDADKLMGHVMAPRKPDFTDVTDARPK